MSVCVCGVCVCVCVCVSHSNEKALCTLSPTQHPTHLTKQCVSCFVEQLWLIRIHVIGHLSKKVLVTSVGEIRDSVELGRFSVRDISGCF